MPNILFVTQCRPMMGANRSLLALIDGLADYGVEMSVACPPGKDTVLQHELAARRIRLIETAIPYNCRLRSREDRRHRLKRLVAPTILQHQSDRIARSAAKQLVSQVKRPDCVYTNTSVTDIGYFAARMFECPHIWHLREFGALDYDLYRSGSARTARARLRAADAVIAISQSVRDHHGLTNDQAHVVPNGVIRESEMHAVRSRRLERESIDHFEGRFSVLGLLRASKGQQTAISAFARALGEINLVAPDAKLDIVGPGKSEELRRLARELGIAVHVRFKGPINDPISILTETDVHLTCSFMEGFGRVTAEAMACGAVAIGNDTGGTREIISHSKNGLLFNGTVNGLAESLISVASSSDLRRNLRMAAWDTAANEFTIERYVSRVLEIVCQACHCLVPEKTNQQKKLPSSNEIDVRKTPTLDEVSRH